MTPSSVLVNRAPVLTLWASIVAERLGYPRDSALTLGKAVAGLNAQSKGRRLGLYPGQAPETKTTKGKKPVAPTPNTITLLGRAVPVLETADGLRAAVDGQPVKPASVARYLSQKFGAALPDVEEAMRILARAYPPKRLASVGYSFYEAFRPSIPEGVKGWGARGRLDLDRIRALAADA